MNIVIYKFHRHFSFSGHFIIYFLYKYNQKIYVKGGQEGRYQQKASREQSIRDRTWRFLEKILIRDIVASEIDRLVHYLPAVCHWSAVLLPTCGRWRLSQERLPYRHLLPSWCHHPPRDHSPRSKRLSKIGRILRRFSCALHRQHQLCWMISMVPN